MRRIFDLLLFPACIAMLVYFGWTYFHGSRSVAANAQIELRISALEKRFEAVRAERVAQDQRVGLLRAQNLDADMLDERARALLQYTAKGEIIIYNNVINQ
jgi:cell division protein FtsB